MVFVFIFLVVRAAFFLDNKGFWVPSSLFYLWRQRLLLKDFFLLNFARLGDMLVQVTSCTFLCWYPLFLVSTGLLELLCCTLELSQSSVVVREWILLLWSLSLPSYCVTLSLLIFCLSYFPPFLLLSPSTSPIFFLFFYLDGLASAVYEVSAVD